MKAYTDIEQSKKLAEILPLESADCVWDYDEMQGFHRINWFEDGFPKESQLRFNENNVCAWSLAALLELLSLPMLTHHSNGRWCIVSYPNGTVKTSDEYNDPIDACYEMILKLHELNLL